MSTIVTRSGKGVPLTATDHDNNVNNLNTDKVETLADLSITSTATEINLLDGVTATTAELNYVDGVTSNIQTQLGTKLPLAGGTMTGTIAGFTSTGIDDNATGNAITINSSENVGIGVVPESWFGNQTALQIGGTGAALSADIGAAYYSNNAYRDSSGNWKRVGSGYATRNMLYNGAYYFDVAGTSTADSAITWTTAMTIDNSGHMLLNGSSSATSGAGTFFDRPSDTTTMPSYLFFKKTFSGFRDAIDFRHNGSRVGSVGFDNTSTSYNTSSDYRLKELDVPMEGSIDRLKLLRPINFAWKVDGSRVDGFFAHEAQEVVPECATGDKDAMVDEEYEVTPAVMDGETVVTEAVMGTRSVPDYQGIDQAKLVPLLVSALQEAIARIEVLENA